jgi:exopolysaccharide biosynthesis WecB/TagA/CpsF family protein
MKIFGVEISQVDYEGLLLQVNNSIAARRGLKITYATAATLNKVYSNAELQKTFAQFDLIHPDGIGVFIASRILYGKNGVVQRMTGSDFYPLLRKKIIEENWRVFFLGDTHETINLLKSRKEKFVFDAVNGFDFDSEDVVNRITSLKPDLIIVGMGQPKQERWVLENKDYLQDKVVLCVGEGIKVFAGNKIRGPKLIRLLGFEWLIRMLYNPIKLWKRYLLGIPVFFVRIIILKIKSKRI